MARKKQVQTGFSDEVAEILESYAKSLQRSISVTIKLIVEEHLKKEGLLND